MHVEIWSDVACPWCYVGKRRFEAALGGFERRDAVAVTWRSFELDPAAPAEQPLVEHLAAKYGSSPDAIRARHAQMTEMARQDGIGFRFDLTRRANTFDAHRTTHLAAAHGLQDAMVERLFRAQHEEGELLTDHGVLRRLAVEAGVPRAAVDEVLADPSRHAADVREDEGTATGLGIRAVPFFVVDRAYGASGAQPPEVLLELLRRAWSERAEALSA